VSCWQTTGSLAEDPSINCVHAHAIIGEDGKGGGGDHGGEDGAGGSFGGVPRVEHVRPESMSEGQKPSGCSVRAPHTK
jgi:hypothetical protein